MNPGKKFEEDFKKSFSSFVDISIDRLKDPMGGFKGEGNICDFIVYEFPYQYYLELKSYDQKSIPMSAISSTQFEGLMGKAYIKGVTAGVLLNYRWKEVNETYFLDIRKVNELKAQEKKSISIEYARENGIELKGERIRTRYKYIINEFLKGVAEYGGRVEIESNQTQGGAEQ
jgi:recombination protein U